MSRHTAGGPGSNQHEIKPPRAPRDATSGATGRVPNLTLVDPLAGDDAEPTLPTAPGQSAEVGDIRVSVEQGRLASKPNNHIIQVERRRDDGSWSRAGFGWYADTVSDLGDGAALATDLGRGEALSVEETTLLRNTARAVLGNG